MSTTLHRRLRPAALMTAVLFVLQGCFSWTSTGVAPRQYLENNHPLQVRVVVAGGGTYTIDGPRVAGDSLIGTVDGSRVAIALGQIVRLAVQKLDAGKSLSAAVGLGVTIAVVTAAGNSGGGSHPAPAPPPSSGGGSSGQGWGLTSCPQVYSWDGTRWRLDSGTFGGAIAHALQRTDLDNLDYATTQGRRLRLKLTDELPETDIVDQIAVLAVDHDPSVTVAPDPNGGIHTVGPLTAPISATDDRGRDALRRVLDADGWNWESNPAGRDTSKLSDIRDGLELVFVRPHGATRARLVLDANNTPWAAYMLQQLVGLHRGATQAWYDSLNASPAYARALDQALAREAFLTVAVRTPAGWASQGSFGEAGPEIVKRQVLDLDLTLVRGDTVRVRLESAPSFWLIDRIGMDFAPERPVRVREMTLTEARDGNGRDVRDLLSAADDRSLSLEIGESAELSFAAPAPVPGMARSYLLRSTGWYHIHTPQTGQPEVALLGRIGTDGYPISRMTVGLLNDALAAMERAAR